MVRNGCTRDFTVRAENVGIMMSKETCMEHGGGQQKGYVESHQANHVILSPVIQGRFWQQHNNEYCQIRRHEDYKRVRLDQSKRPQDAAANQPGSRCAA